MGINNIYVDFMSKQFYYVTQSKLVCNRCNMEILDNVLFYHFVAHDMKKLSIVFTKCFCLGCSDKFRQSVIFLFHIQEQKCFKTKEIQKHWHHFSPVLQLVEQVGE